jgi:hypothetical protein
MPVKSGLRLLTGAGRSRNLEKRLDVYSYTLRRDDGPDCVKQPQEKHPENVTPICQELELYVAGYDHP